MAGETYWRCGECGGIHPHELSAQQCCMANSDAIEPVAILPVQELADLRRLRDRVKEAVAPLLVERTHYYCEDTWYSCPKHPEGCANDGSGDECNCGADEWNALVAKARAALRKETP
jgi:hypothetical protein